MTWKVDSSDSQLLGEVQNLCKVLNLTVQVRRLLWLDRITASKVASDECRFGLDLVIFPDRMKGKLELKEWKPVIASSLIYRKILVRSLPVSILVTALAAFVFLIVGAGVISAIFGTGTGLPFFLYTFLVVGPFAVNRITQARKKQKLQADLLAARVVGTHEFLSMLEKIDGMGVREIIATEKRRFSRHFSSRPSVAERIANLSQTK